MTTRLAWILVLTAGALGVARPARAGGSGILNSKHNLSVTGPGEVRAISEKRTCVFCHVAHGSRPRAGNRPDSAAVVQRYASSTMAAPSGIGITGASRTCLSCHDGTIALGQTSKGKGIAMALKLLAGRYREVHPVMYIIAAALAARYVFLR